MGIFRAIIDFFRRLFGLSREPVLSLGTASSDGRGSPPRPAADPEDDDTDDTAGDGPDDATRDGQLNIEDEWADLQVLIARCEAESLDLAGLDIRDPMTFWTRQQRIEAGQRGGKGRLHAVVAAGFRSLEHWDEVSRYYQAKWSQLARRGAGELEIRPLDEFTAAALRARSDEPRR
jgi:hypothetical protein